MAKRSAKRASIKTSIDTISELAALVDRDVGTVSRWLKRDDWPFPKRPPFQRSLVPKILRWVADTLLVRESNEAVAEEGEPADEMKALRKEKLKKEIRKLHAQADTAETALARERGHLLDAHEVERQWSAMGLMVRNAFQALPSQIVPLALNQGMPHEASAQFMQQVEESIAAILRRLSTDEDGRAENDEDSAAEVPCESLPA